MQGYLFDEMRNALRTSTSKPLIICGSGVSREATNNKAPTWAGLIVSGIARVAGLDSNANLWAEKSREAVTSNDQDILIRIADEITDRLGGSQNAEFKTWLGDQLAGLLLEKRDLIDAIVGLGCQIATTNYDDLLETATGLSPISWVDYAATHDFLCGKLSGILHLHGHWRSPSQVVLGSRSYEKLSDDKRRQLLQDITTLDRPTFLIGCGQDGLSDPDFSRLDSFLEEWKDVAPRRYWFLRQEIDGDGNPKPIPSPIPDRRLYPVAFGSNFDDLKETLRSLVPDKSAAAMDSPNDDRNVRCIDQQEPRPELFGRASEVASVVAAACAGRHAIIAGGPGMGKPAIAVSALYEQKTIAQFGKRRVFVSLDSASEPRALLTQLANALGIPSGGDDKSLQHLLGSAVADHPTVAILDNAETLFDVDRSESERFLRLLAQVKNMSLILTIRGVPPALPGALVISDLPRLESGAATQAFLEIAGPSFEEDPDLPRLLDILDGHALSICLIAARASGSSSLAGLRESWEETHAAILRRPGEPESRLTSVRASFALSLGSQRIIKNPFARRLLSVISHLPGGLAEDDVRFLLADRGGISKSKANDAIECLHQLRIIERRKDRRLRMLTPLRECAKSDCELMAADKKRLIDRYLELAKRAGTVGSQAWRDNQDAVSADAENLDPICSFAVVDNIGDTRIVRALHGLSSFHFFTGLAAIGSLKTAISLLPRNSAEAANILERLGTNYRLSQPTVGEDYFKQARSAFHASQIPEGEADCLYELGTLEQRRGNYGLAQQYFDRAMALSVPRYPSMEGRVMLGIATLEGHRSKFARAREMALGALSIFKKTASDEIAEANCHTLLSQIEFTVGNIAVAREHMEEALPRYRSTGALVGEANCIERQGHIALSLSDHVGVMKYCTKALDIHRKLGNILGEANAISVLADLAIEERNFDLASAHMKRAESLYDTAEDMPGRAGSIYRLGETSSWMGEQDIADRYVAAALKIFREKEHVLGQALCLRLQAIIAERRGHYAESARIFEQQLVLLEGTEFKSIIAKTSVALGLLRESLSGGSDGRALIVSGFSALFDSFDPSDLALPGWRELHLAVSSANSTEAARHFTAARRAWQSIKRLDLIDEWLDLRALSGAANSTSA